MANYSSLLAAVNAAITANGTGAITGPVLNTVLQQMIVSLGQGGYIFKGRAIPTTDPGSPDQNVFYIATTPGTYTNFSSIVVAAGECAILKGSGTSWSKEATGIDLVSVSQNISTGHTDINIGSDSYPVASVEEVNQLGKDLGVLYDNNGEKTPNNTTLFTSDDVSNGDRIFFTIESAYNNAYGKIALFDSSDTRIAEYGFLNGSTLGEVMSGNFVIPSNFSYAKMVDSGNIIVRYLSTLEHPIKEEVGYIYNNRWYVVESPYTSRIKELYLTGLDSSKNYIIRYCRYYSGIPAYQVYISDASAPDTFLACYENIIGNGLIRLDELNSSGISGYAVINMTSSDTTNMNGVPINQGYVTDLSGNKTISLYFAGNYRKEITVAKDGSGDFSTMRSALEFGVKLKGTKVFVKNGLYDLTSEFGSEIENSRTTKYGLPLGNGIHIIGEKAVIISAIYSGNDPNVTTYFNPFHVLFMDGGFTLENIEIRAKNTRYCVHDEYNGANVYVHNKYINCKMSMDNITAPINYYPSCIGGGLARYSTIEIINCIFYTAKAETEVIGEVIYHNQNSYSNGFSKIVISGCNFRKKGTFASLNYGSVQDVSEVWLCNNSFGSAPINADISGAQYVNMTNIEWCNEIRSE